MGDESKDYLALLKAGKLDEARELIEQEMIKAKTEPNCIAIKSDGSAKFTYKGKSVEPDGEGGWRFKSRLSSVRNRKR